MEGARNDIVISYQRIRDSIPMDVSLVCVSKFHSMEDIMCLYEVGQRDFGESYVQELVEKAAKLPKDIRWHFIGHLQTNKVKLILPFVYLIHSVDSIHLLNKIQEMSYNESATTKVLLEFHVAAETTKTGFDISEIDTIHVDNFPNVSICGVMGMATQTKDEYEIRRCFRQIVQCGKRFPSILSMGMSEDYRIAVSEGTNMVRIGSAIFGVRG